MCREPKPCLRLDEQRERCVVGDAVRQPGRRRRDASFLEQDVREVLVLQPFDRLGIRQEQQCAELVPRAGEHDLVEIRERDDEADVLLLDERPQRGHVLGVVDARDEGVAVGMVERRGEGIRVRRHGHGACPAKSAHDVHALSRAREENRRHGDQYSRNGRLARAEAARRAAVTSRTRPGRPSIA